MRSFSISVAAVLLVGLCMAWERSATPTAHAQGSSLPLGTGPFRVDCNSNGIPDSADISVGTSADCNTNGTPDECEADCAGGAPELKLNLGPPQNACVLSGEPVVVTLSMDCLLEAVRGYQAFIAFDPDALTFGSGVYHLPDPFGIPILAPVLAEGGALDVAAGIDDGNGQTPARCPADLVTLYFVAGTTPGAAQVWFRPHDPPTRLSGAVGNEIAPGLVNSPSFWIAGQAQDCADCNTNGTADVFDIQTGTSPDCQDNGIPDECDVAVGTSLDCNTNGIPDECDLGSGTSADVNTNGIPDECECGCTDFVLVIDNTGSMVGAIEDVRSDLDRVIDVAVARAGGDLRLGLITFKDSVTVVRPLTDDIVAVRQSILELGVSGGGNEPEASDEALREMITTNALCRVSPLGFDTPFRGECFKLAALITDARPGGCDDVYVAGVDDANAHQRALDALSAGIEVSAVLIPKTYPPGWPIESIMRDYADTTGGLFTEVAPDGTGTADALLRVLRACPGCGAYGDLVEDGVVRGDDYAVFEACLGGPGVYAAPICRCADFDADFDIDLQDFAAFQTAFTGG